MVMWFRVWPRWGLGVLKVEGEALQRVCPKTGRNPRSGSPIIPREIFLVGESECNSAPRKKLTSDLQTVCVSLNRNLTTQISSIRVSPSVVLLSVYFRFIAGGADWSYSVSVMLRSIRKLRGVHIEARIIKKRMTWLLSLFICTDYNK